MFCVIQKGKELSWRSSGWDSVLPLQGAQVRSLIRVLRSHMAQSKKGKKTSSKYLWMDISCNFMSLDFTGYPPYSLQQYNCVGIGLISLWVSADRDPHESWGWEGRGLMYNRNCGLIWPCRVLFTWRPENSTFHSWKKWASLTFKIAAC